MKSLLISLLSALTVYSNAQDTLSYVKRPDGSSTQYVYNGIDTFYMDFYPNGKLESKRSKFSPDSSWKYERFYMNGRYMWVKEMKNASEFGKSTFFHENGEKVAELLFDKDGLISDTLYLNANYKLLLGKASYYSVVFGGMANEDGTSNVRGGPGTYMHTPMYTVRMDSNLIKQTVYSHFRTDYNGAFSLILDSGNYGFFPNDYKIENVKPDMGTPPGQGGGGWHSSWNLSKPLEIKNELIYTVNLHYEFIGYAP